MNKKILTTVLGKIPYGLYLISSKTEHGVATIIVTWVCQVSFTPPLVSVSIEKDSEMRVHIERSRYFSINMLAEDSVDFAKGILKKSGSHNSNINGKETILTKNGTPFLKEAVASFECKVVEWISTGDHVLFIGEVLESICSDSRSILTLAATGWKYAR